MNSPWPYVILGCFATLCFALLMVMRPESIQPVTTLIAELARIARDVLSPTWQQVVIVLILAALWAFIAWVQSNGPR